MNKLHNEISLDRLSIELTFMTAGDAKGTLLSAQDSNSRLVSGDTPPLLLTPNDFNPQVIITSVTKPHVSSKAGHSLSYFRLFFVTITYRTHVLLKTFSLVHFKKLLNVIYILS